MFTTRDPRVMTLSTLVPMACLRIVFRCARRPSLSLQSATFGRRTKIRPTNDWRITSLLLLCLEMRMFLLGTRNLCCYAVISAPLDILYPTHARCHTFHPSLASFRNLKFIFISGRQRLLTHQRVGACSNHCLNVGAGCKENYMYHFSREGCSGRR